MPLTVEERLKMLQEFVDLPSTPAAKSWRIAIFNNIVSYIRQSNGDDAVFKNLLWMDYLAWVAWNFDGEKYPIFLTRKQYSMYKKFKEFDTNTWLYQRRAGKS